MNRSAHAGDNNEQELIDVYLRREVQAGAAEPGARESGFVPDALGRLRGAPITSG